MRKTFLIIQILYLLLPSNAFSKHEHPDYKNGLFTYYLLKGLRGEADNGDKSLTVAELHNYVQKNVEDTTKALYNDLPQVPILFTSSPDRVICRLT